MKVANVVAVKPILETSTSPDNKPSDTLNLDLEGTGFDAGATSHNTVSLESQGRVSCGCIEKYENKFAYFIYSSFSTQCWHIKYGCHSGLKLV